MMLPLAAVLLAYTGVAAAFAAGSRSKRRPAWISPRVASILYVLAGIAVVAAALLWPRSDGAVLAGLCVVMVVSAMATLFVLLEPIAPRVTWWAAAIAPALAVLLAVLD